jgi:hypothetical protein
LKTAFDYIDHDHLLSALGAFPGKGLVADWLEAGVIEKGWFTPPRIEGTIHQAVTAAGARRTRYAGLGKTALAHILTVTAVNLVQLDAWWSGQPLAPTRTSHLAALDLAA